MEASLLTTIAWLSIAVAFACALWIAVDGVRHPQAMAIVNRWLIRAGLKEAM